MLGNANAGEPGMRDRAADERDFAHARKLDVANNWPRPRRNRSSSLRHSRAPTPVSLVGRIDCPEGAAVEIGLLIDSHRAPSV